MIYTDRKRRLLAAMAEVRLDMLVVYGNAWQSDYLRYTTDYSILEGQALALVRADGQVTLYLDSPIEVDRAAQTGDLVPRGEIEQFFKRTRCDIHSSLRIAILRETFRDREYGKVAGLAVRDLVPLKRC